MSSNVSDNCTLYLALLSLENISALHVPFNCVRYSTLFEVFLIVVFVVLFIGTAGGNFLVISSVVLVKKLQTPSNFLIVSLACSDFLVSILVLPGAVYQQINRNRWPFSELLCDVFISFDVILCTSSILNLCAISIDRYLVITRPLQYAVKRTPARIATMVAISWASAALISIPPMIGWKDTFIPGQCNYSENLIYQIYATFGAFYIPLLVMLVLYGRIFKLAREMAHADNKLNVQSSSSRNTHKSASKDNESSFINAPMEISVEMGSIVTVTKETNNIQPSNGVKYRRSRSHTDSKAITTLGVIMGCFTICWLPFFILQIVKSVLKVANINYMVYLPLWLMELCLWLGYVNSFLNPIIYVKFNREFRTPFKQILLFKCCSINARLRSETFVQEYGLAGGPSKGSACGRRPSLDQASATSNNLHGGRRRRVPSSTRSNVHSFKSCENYSQSNHSRPSYLCSRTDHLDTKQFPLSGQIGVIGDVLIQQSLLVDPDPTYYVIGDHVTQCYRPMFDQTVDKFVFDFGPSSETGSIDSPQPIDVSTLDLTNY